MTAHGNSVLRTGSPTNLGDIVHSYHSALGFSTDGSTNPDPLTNSNNHFNPTWNDRLFIPPAGSQGALSLPPPALGSAHDQFNEIHPYNKYTLGPTYSEPSVSAVFYQATLLLTTTPESTVSAQQFGYPIHLAHFF
jgi:hypothetical protein